MWSSGKLGKGTQNVISSLHCDWLINFRFGETHSLLLLLWEEKGPQAIGSRSPGTWWHLDGTRVHVPQESNAFLPHEPEATSPEHAREFFQSLASA